MIRRLLHRIDRLVTRHLDRHLTAAGVLPAREPAGSVSPLSLVDRYHATGLPPRAHPHSRCCEEAFGPAPCPLTHTEGPCRLCDEAS
jgi:hypothetical protein